MCFDAWSTAGDDKRNKETTTMKKNGLTFGFAAQSKICG